MDNAPSGIVSNVLWYFVIDVVWGQSRNLRVGVPGYRLPKVVSTHFCRLVTDSETTFPQSRSEGKTQ